MAELVHYRALCYAARFLTDGFIPSDALGRLCVGIPDDPLGVPGRLVDAGLWKVSKRGGWNIHDFLKYNPDKETVEAARERNSQRQQEFRERRRNAVTNAVTNGPVTLPPSPSPSPKRLQSVGDSVAVLEAFERFKTAYPRKQAWKDARKAWVKLSPNTALQARIFAAIDAQRQTRQWQEGIYPLPASWIRGERWNDEVERHEAPASMVPRKEFVMPKRPEANPEHVGGLLRDLRKKFEGDPHDGRDARISPSPSAISAEAPRA